MLKKKIASAVAAAALVVIAMIGGTYAFSDRVSVLNHIETGDVNIGIAEFMVSGERETAFQNFQVVYPGQEISKIPRIYNYAEPCWIRTSVSFDISNKELTGLNESNLRGISDDWIKIGDYWYYRKPLKTGETADLFTSVMIPPEWTKAYSGQDLKIEVRADAVQEVHFTPDFEAMSPWGDTEIEKCIHEINGKVIEEKENVKLYVEFEGKANRLVAVPDDFFSNLRKLMPGDELTDEVKIRNTTDRDAEIFFNTGLDSLTEEQLDLLEHIKLQISFEGTLLYDGNLKADSLNEKVSLGVYKPGDERTLTFKVTVPPELNNAYAVRESNVRWIFSVEQDDPVPTVTPTVIPTETPAPTPTPAADEHLKGTLNTGDDSPIMVLAIVFGAAVAILGVAIAVKSGRKKSS